MCEPRKSAAKGEYALSKLTAKQQRFVEEYLIDLNATQAAIRAGYSEKTAKDMGCENLAKPNIAEAIDEALAMRSEETKIDAAYVLKQAVKLHERCMSEIEPDAEVGVFKFNAAGAAKALELVGKHVGVQAFREQVGVGNPDGTAIDFDTSKLSDTSLSELMAARNAVAD